MKLFWKILIIAVCVILFGGVTFAVLGKFFHWSSILVDWLSTACDWVAKLMDWLGIRGILGV